MAVHLQPEWNDCSTQANWKVIHSLPEWWAGLREWKWDSSSFRRSSQPTPGREGADDWYNMYMRDAQGMISEPPVPLYPVGTAEARKEAIGHIYDQVAGKEPPTHNVASRALRAYYTRVDPQTLSTWACQILCMIGEYHMACMTRGSTVTARYCQGNSQSISCLWLTTLLPKTSRAPPMSGSGTIGPELCEWLYCAIGWIWPSVRSLAPPGP